MLGFLSVSVALPGWPASLALSVGYMTWKENPENSPLLFPVASVPRQSVFSSPFSVFLCSFPICTGFLVVLSGRIRKSMPVFTEVGFDYDFWEEKMASDKMLSEFIWPQVVSPDLPRAASPFTLATSVLMIKSLPASSDNAWLYLEDPFQSLLARELYNSDFYKTKQGIFLGRVDLSMAKWGKWNILSFS